MNPQDINKFNANRNQRQQQWKSIKDGTYQPIKHDPQPIVVECPYCKSKNTKKISSIGKGISILTLGLLSSKIGKQWHCNKCDSDF